MGKKFDIAKFASSLGPPAEGVRDIETITSEIIQLKQDAGNAILGIGNRLIEAKAMLSHGEWLTWLSERVDFSERTAQNFMRLAREWSNPQALADLGATKALTLLALPPEERDAFINEKHSVNGEEKTVIDMTSRELEKAIRERDEARQAMEAAQAEAQSAEESRAKMQADMEQLKALQDAAKANAERAQADLQTARAELEALRNKPVEVAIEKVVDEVAVKRAREQAINEMKSKVATAESGLKTAVKKIEDLQKRVDENAEAIARAEKAEAELADARQKLEDAAKAEKQTALDNDPDLAAFQLYFDQAKENVNRMNGIKMKLQVKDPEAVEKMKNALRAFADIVRGCAE